MRRTRFPGGPRERTARMLSLFLSLCAIPQASVPSAGASAVHQEPAGIDTLVQEYERAFEAWAGEMSRTGAVEKPEGERPPGPAPAFWPRFEALAQAGEGRAVLWLLDNMESAGGDTATKWRQLFERVRAAGDAEWVASALPRLGTQDSEAEVLAMPCNTAHVNRAALTCHASELTALRRPSARNRTATTFRSRSVRATRGGSGRCLSPWIHLP